MAFFFDFSEIFSLRTSSSSDSILFYSWVSIGALIGGGHGSTLGLIGITLGDVVLPYDHFVGGVDFVSFYCLISDWSTVYVF